MPDKRPMRPIGPLVQLNYTEGRLGFEIPKIPNRSESETERSDRGHDDGVGDGDQTHQGI